MLRQLSASSEYRDIGSTDPAPNFWDLRPSASRQLHGLHFPADMDSFSHTEGFPRRRPSEFPPSARTFHPSWQRRGHILHWYESELAESRTGQLVRQDQSLHGSRGTAVLLRSRRWSRLPDIIP